MLGRGILCTWAASRDAMMSLSGIETLPRDRPKDTQMMKQATETVAGSGPSFRAAALSLLCTPCTPLVSPVPGVSGLRSAA